MQSSLWQIFFSAFQAAVSVLLTIFYGVLAGNFGILDDHSTQQMSKLCITAFLPALLLTDVGSQLNPGNVTRYAVIVVWSLLYTFSSLALSFSLRRLFRLPQWTIVATSFNNTTSMPLLLTQTLAATNFFDVLLKSESDTVGAAIKRAQSYFLANSLCTNVVTFTVGPKILNAPDGSREGEDGGADASPEGQNELHDGSHDDERTPLLPPSVLERSAAARHKIHAVSQNNFQKLPYSLRRTLTFSYSLLNPPLIGGILGAFIGLIPPLHQAFFNNSQDGGIFNAWLMTSVQNVGDLFAALQIIVVGVRLSQCLRKMVRGEDSGKVPLFGALLTLVIRYAVWPVVSIGVIYAVQSRTTWLAGDPVLPFALMVMPLGPSALNLASLTDVAGSSEKEKLSMAKFLTISYALSPLLSFAVVGSLKATQASIG